MGTMLFALCATTLTADENDGEPPAPATLIHVDEGQVVDFDLSRGRIPRALPFDVDFVLKAKVPASTRSVTATQREALNGKKSEACAGSPRVLDVSDPFGETDRFVEANVDRLEVARNYCFQFVVVRDRSEEESKTIVAALRAPLLKLYRNTDPLLAARDLWFRKEVKRAIERAVLPPTIVVVSPGSYLNDEVTYATLDERMLFEMPLQVALNARQKVRRYLSIRETIGGLVRTPTLAYNGTTEDVAAELTAVEEEIANIASAAADLEDAKVELVAAQTLLARLAGSIDEVAAALDDRLVDEYNLEATTKLTYEGRFYWYVSADLGVGVAPETENFFQYLGVNLYFRPVNKKADLEDFSWEQQVPRRLAITVGVGEKLKTAELTGLLDDRPLLLGAGFRVTSHFRISAGMQVFQEDDPDPLVTSNQLTVTPYIGVSLDYDIASSFKSFISPMLGGN